MKSVIIPFSIEQELALMSFFNNRFDVEGTEERIDAYSKLVDAFCLAHVVSMKEIKNGKLPEEWIVLKADYDSDEEDDLIELLEAIKATHEPSKQEQEALAKLALGFIRAELVGILSGLVEEAQAKARAESCDKEECCGGTCTNDTQG